MPSNTEKLIKPSNSHILILEDTESDASLAMHELKHVIDSPVFKVVDNESDFQDALMTFEPDLILSDYRLPGYDGLSALRLNQRVSPEIPLIIFTGSLNEDTAVECLKAGAADYVIKEHIKRLGAAVINALEQRKIITEKKRAETLLQISEMMYHRMFEDNPQPMLIYDLDTLDILEVNHALVKQYGFTREEFLHMTLRDLRPAGDLKMFEQMVDSARAEINKTHESRHLKKNGELIYVEITAHTIAFNGRRSRHVLIKDITDRKIAEESLRKNEEKYRSLFESVQDIYYQIDMQGKILEISPSIHYYSQFSREELIQTHVSDLYYAPVDRETFLNVILEKGELRDYELRLKTKNGALKYVSINARLIYDADHIPHHIEGALRDITERKKAEEKLFESEERFRNLFINSQSVMLVIDPVNGSIFDVNPAAAEFYGYSREDLLTMHIRDINLLDDTLSTLFTKALSGNQVFFETRQRTASGLIRDVEIFSGKTTVQGKIYLHTLVHDISDRKRAQQQNILLSRAIEQSPVSVVITDPDGNIEYVNPRFTELTGYFPEEAIGNTPRILKSQVHPQSFYANLWKTILSGHNWSGEFQNRKKNGELYWENAQISPIVDEKGKIIHFVAVKEDITEKKKMVEELIAAKERAEVADRLKTSFLHNISHEIRTPLNAIVGFSSFLASPKLSDAKKQEFVDIISMSSNQLVSIISDIISVATLEAGQEKANIQEANINTILFNVHEQFKHPFVRPNIEFRYTSSLPDNQSTVRTDPVKLMQILVNLVGNALKFTENGTVEFGCEKKEDHLHFYVKDSGIGIPDEMVAEIFKRFRQVDETATRKFGGMGLGLAISKGYVELLGGRIWVRSQPDLGSEFCFTIPYDPVIKEETDAPEFLLQEAGLLSNKTILVAEDEKYNYLLIHELIRYYDAKLIHAVNGLEAVNKCRETGIPDLILMDIKMPVMDGIEATKLIRKMDKQVPIIAVSAYALNSDKKRFLEAGCNDFLEKPFKQKILGDMLLKYLLIPTPSLNRG